MGSDNKHNSNSRLARRIPYLDALRVLACVLVLLVHGPILYNDAFYYHQDNLYAPFIVLITVSSKLFFLISGALLLPVTRPWREFLRRRLGVVLIPLILWSVIYLLEHAFLLHNFTPRLLVSILFHPVEGSLWFVYVMVVIYITMPLMTRVIQALGKRGVEAVLILWALSSFIPYQHGVFIEASQFSHNMLSGFANYFGYVLLGYYLHHYPLPVFTRQHGWKFALLFIFGIVIVPLFEFTVQSHFGISWQQHIDTVTSDISINDVMMAVLLMSTAQRLCPQRYDDGKPHRLSMVIMHISICTYGIYLGHMLILRQIVWPAMCAWGGFGHWLPDGVLCSVLAFIITFAIMRLIYCLPFSKYIMGR